VNKILVLDTANKTILRQAILPGFAPFRKSRGWSAYCK